MKTQGCEYEPKVISGGSPDDATIAHIAGCEHCRETINVSGLIKHLSKQTAPPTLPSPGFLIFKASLRKKYADTGRALLPLTGMHAAALVAFVAVSAWFVAKSRMPLGAVLGETYRSFSAAAPLFLLGLTGGVLLCLTAAYFLRDPQR